MVRTTLAALVVAGLAAAGPALGQSVDWRGAGGDLFGRTEPVAEAPAAAAADPARLAPLSQPYQAAIDEAAARHGVDPKLLSALVLTESGYDARVCSPAGACGLAQIMPATARELGVADRLDPVQSLRGGADYLARQLVRFGDVRLALAAYNAGPGRVARLGRVPDIEETRQYVAVVIDCYLALTAGRAPLRRGDCAPLAIAP